MDKLKDLRCGVIIVAGGCGVRFGADIPKQFLLLGDKPVLLHTILAFSRLTFINHIVVVLPSEHQAMWTELCDKYQLDMPHITVSGGVERFYSVQNGLQHLKNCDVIGIHDGVRPVVSIDLIKRCFSMAVEYGSCVPVVPVTDSLRRGDFFNHSIVSRKNLYRVQTPQVFQRRPLFEAYKQAFDSKFTDDASVLEKMGYDINLTDGEECNIKITGKTDMELASFYLSRISTT